MSPEEVKAAFKKLKSNKAPGVYGTTAEMIKAGGQNIVLWLTQIINHVWVHEMLPSDWRQGIILPFWKRKGDQLVDAATTGVVAGDDQSIPSYQYRANFLPSYS